MISLWHFSVLLQSPGLALMLSPFGDLVRRSPELQDES
jgi:hypothetical protein